MGVYKRTEQDGVGPPVYKKQGAEHYLWCLNACGAGLWAVAGNKGLVGGQKAPWAHAPAEDAPLLDSPALPEFPPSTRQSCVAFNGNIFS